MVWHLVSGKHTIPQQISISNIVHFLEKGYEKKPFLVQVGEIAEWIGYLQGKRLKPKTIKGYLAGLWSLYIEYTLDEAEL